MNTRWSGSFLAAGISLLLVAAAGRAEAQRSVEVYGGLLKKGAAAKRTKKQKAIDRHLFTAQYFLLREGDADAAAREYRKVLALDRGNVHAGLAVADIEVGRKRFKQATSVLSKLTRTARKDGSVWLALARAHQAAGNDKGMKKACAAAIQIDPKGGEAHWLLYEAALARHKAGDASARAELARAARGYLGSRYLASGPKRRQAERTLISLDGDKVALAVFDARNAYDDAFASGSVGQINQRMAEARRGFEACVAARPDRQECHYHLGRVYGSIKASEHYDPRKAVASLKRAPDLPEAHVELARLYRVEDDLSAASRELARAIKLAPSMALAHLELGIVRKLDGNDDAAVQSFVAAYQANRYSATADRAIGELAKIRPKHPLVASAMMFGDGIFKGDVFSTERFKAAVKMVEDQLGGVEDKAPEKAVLEQILARLRHANDVGSRVSFRVSVLKTSMVNAFALPDGSLYFTRGMFDFLKRKWPKRPINANHDVLGHIMGHEMSHVLRRHTVQSLIYQEAQKDASTRMDPAVLTHVTRLHEIEADRDGIVMAFLAGYHPRGGVEFMEVSGQEMEIPSHLDHPTYEERVHYLEEYWSNDVKYAFQSFRLGLASLKRGEKLEAAGAKGAAGAYEQAVDHFKRFRGTLKPTRDVLNNLGIAYARLGVMALGNSGTPLGRWRSRFSVEQAASIQYASIVREPRRKTRGAKREAARKVPWQLREASSLFQEALKIDGGYLKARLNLTLTHLALGKTEDALRELNKVRESSAEVWLLRGIVSAEKTMWPQAIAAFRHALAAKSLARVARFNLARAYQGAGQKAEAKAQYRSFLKVEPKGPWSNAARKALEQL